MANDNCTYQSITLKAGEQFVLPPNAQIIGLTDETAITSENDCADLTNLETLGCYIAKIVGYYDPGQVGTWFEGINDPQKIAGFTYNGVFSAASGELRLGASGNIYSPSAPDNICQQIKDAIPAIISYNGVDYNNGSGTNFMVIYQIQTFPSVAENLFINIQTNAENFSPADAPYIIPFLPRASVDLGEATLPDLCSTI